MTFAEKAKALDLLMLQRNESQPTFLATDDQILSSTHACDLDQEPEFSSFINFITMDVSTKFVRQHLIDPKLCLRCGACEAVCEQSAIVHTPDFSMLAVDPFLCEGNLDCLEACSTGAIESWRTVLEDETYSLETQMGWSELPAESTIDAASVPVLAEHGPPLSAATPQIMLYSATKPAVATLVENRRLCLDEASSDVRHIVLDASSVHLPVLEGQSLGVLAPGTDENGQPHDMRIYSIASPRDGENGVSGHIALTVKRVTEDYDGQPVTGVCSNHLCDLQPGASLRLVGPVGGSFLMSDDPEARLVMICTGTGIAPMRGMIERRKSLRLAAADSLRLYYGVRTLDEMPYREELQADAESGLVDLRVALSRQPGENKRYVQHLLIEDAEFIVNALSDPNAYIYICGLKNMESGVIDALRDACAAHNHDWDSVHTELRLQRRLHIETY